MPKGLKLSDDAKAQISRAQKARWRKWRADKKQKLQNGHAAVAVLEPPAVVPFGKLALDVERRMKLINAEFHMLATFMKSYRRFQRLQMSK